LQSTEIKKLPEDLINQIKAGEVVERPYNIVKEVVENSIDAGAKNIQIELLDGGKQLIRITDDGCGIPANQILTALERHATSKIKKFHDLESLASFGFRGEALPSIASISHFTIRSRPQNQEMGKEININYGNLVSEKELSMPHGTVIQVKDIFTNVPVRLKFLKSTATEFTHIHDFLIAMALANYHISFRFSHNGREVFHYHSKKSLKERFHDIVGVDAKDFVELNHSRGSFNLTGFAGLPKSAKQNPSYFITFVNGRYVKDKIIRSGVLQAYQGLLIKGLIAPAIIFVKVNPSWVDVNAHPSKTEIRFYDPASLQELVSIGIQEAVKDSVHQSNKPINNLIKNSNDIYIQHNISKIENKNPYASEKNFAFETNRLKDNFTNKLVSTEKDGPILPHKNSFQKDIISTPLSKGTQVAKLKANESMFEPLESKIIQPKKNNLFETAKYLGQFANCYILLEIIDDLWIIDQHAFHERILYEEIMKNHLENKVPKQDLISPIIIPSNEVLTTIIFEQKDKILSLGFEIEALKNGHIAIHAFPSFLNTQKVPEIFDEIITRIIAINGLPQSEAHPLLEKANKVTKGIQEEMNLQPTQLKDQDIYHLLFATMACHNAVRSGDPLNEELVKRLLGRSNDVDFYSHCPHGRPVIRKFTNKDVSSWFQRI
jgi:DNA mismatch repair protein MutL